MTKRINAPARPRTHTNGPPSPPSTRRRRWVRILVGLPLFSLGLLWILQGADVVHIQPVLCVADCEPVTGGAPGWLAVGVATAGIGLFLASGVRLRRS